MANIMKLTREEVTEHPWDIVKKIEKIIRGEEKEDVTGVRLNYVNASGFLWKFKFGGIALDIFDVNYKRVYRRVKVIFIKDKQEWEIDLDKVKEKYEEMKKLAIKFEEDRKKRDEDIKQNQELISELKGRVKDIEITGSRKFAFVVSICNLTEEEVKKVVEFVKTLKGA